eukprot:TRINITY_DN81295_c0_g1_i1.p1 TRINITY_DN81295_c0_g1~~TRINITY_DN81295_c0_g1_i1.p1  ORF type:complete len:463 (+),score=62.60 TRINITY_DN81295_c0_g1_i1:144-1532(+)
MGNNACLPGLDGVSHSQEQKAVRVQEATAQPPGPVQPQARSLANVLGRAAARSRESPDHADRSRQGQIGGEDAPPDSPVSPDNTGNAAKQRWQELRAVGHVLGLRTHLYDKAGKELPHVEITVRVIRLANFDVKGQRFHVDFLVMLDWIDEYLVGANPEEVDWNRHFVPRISINNAAHEMDPDNTEPRLYEEARGWARLTARYRGELLAENLDMHKYPFDSQVLSIQVKSLRKYNKKVVLADPSLRRESEHYQAGHVYSPGANQLDAWEIYGSLTGRQLESADQYTLDIGLRRRCHYPLMNMCLPVFLMNVLSFAVFGIDAGDLSSRLQITLTLMLTVTTFKSSVTTELPVYSYLTIMDKYFVYSIFVSFANAVEHALARALESVAGRTAVTIAEWLWIFLQFGCFVGIHRWLLQLYGRWEAKGAVAAELGLSSAVAPLLTSRYFSSASSCLMRDGLFKLGN